MTSTTSYPPELWERAMRMVVEHRGEHPSAWAAMGSSCRWTHCRCSRPPPLLASRACWPGPPEDNDNRFHSSSSRLSLDTR